MMNDIFNLLNINSESFRDFPLQANLVADLQIEKVINSNARRLKKIESAMFADKQVEISTQSIEEVIRKVKKASNANDLEIDWSTRELRIVAYYLVKLQGNDSAFNFAIALLEARWRNLFFNGLVFYVMNAWNNTEKMYRDKVCQLITKKLNLYQEKNKRYLMLKNHANFFEVNGPLRFASLMKHRNESILTAPEIIGFRASTITLAYYSDVIINFFGNGNNADLSDIEEILSKHTLGRTKKLLFANLIEEADKNNDTIKQTQISKFASRILGDISLSTTWAPFTDATPEEEAKLKNARRLVNKWYARKIIEVFFDVCVQDVNRRNYWLQYIDHIDEFRISGSSAVRSSLNSDYRISGMFQNYFIETSSRKIKTAALILYIRNKVFVEFSDLGSLYIYNKDNNRVKTLNKKRFIDNINDLKDTSLLQAVESDYSWYYFNHEGCMRHAGHWQDRLDSWFRKMLNLNIMNQTAFSQSIPEFDMFASSNMRNY